MESRRLVAGILETLADRYGTVITNKQAGLAHFRQLASSCFAVCAIENGVLAAIASARDCKEIVLRESSCKSEKNYPSQSSSDFKTD